MFKELFEDVKKQADKHFLMLSDYGRTVGEVLDYQRGRECYPEAISDLVWQKLLGGDNLQFKKYCIFQQGEDPAGYNTAENAKEDLAFRDGTLPVPEVFRFGIRCRFIKPELTMAVLREFWLPGEELTYLYARASDTPTVARICDGGDIPPQHWRALNEGLREMVRLFGREIILKENDFLEFFSNYF